MNEDATKYSICKLTSTNDKTGKVDEYFTYKEGIQIKFPGYEVDENSIVQNISDFDINYQEHLTIMLSKDLSLYTAVYKAKNYS